MDLDRSTTSLTSPVEHSVRFVALRGAERATLLRFHPRLTVLAGFAETLPGWLASVFEHGRHGAPDGFVALDGERTHLGDLPDAVFAAGGCPFVPADALEHDPAHFGSPSSDTLGFELRAVVDAIASGLQHADAIKHRIALVDEELAVADARIAELQAAQPEVVRSLVALDRTEDAEQLERLVAAAVAAETLPKEVHPDADALAHRFDALDDAARRYRPREDVEEELRKWELVTAEARARLAERRASAPRVSPADLAQAAQLHETVEDDAARRASAMSAGNDAGAVHDDVLDTQYKALLSRLGVRSYDELLLLGTGLGSASVDLAIREATNVVAAAERRCSDLRAVLAEPSVDDLRAERESLLEQARMVLGSDPGNDPATALRAHRVEPHRYVATQVALANKLRELGARVDTTVVDTARTLIDDWHEQQAQQERSRSELERLAVLLAEAERFARQSRTARERLETELEAQLTKVEDLDLDRRRLEARVHEVTTEPEVTTITPAIIDRAVNDMLAVARGGHEGASLPIIVDDPFGGLDPELHRHALSALARRAGSQQVVLVTHDAATVTWAQRAGDNVALAWTLENAMERMARMTGQTA
jgi:hypothetical protein